MHIILNCCIASRTFTVNNTNQKNISTEKNSSEQNLGCESIDSAHAIIKMCTAFSHVSLSLPRVPLSDTSERRKMRA